MIMIYYLGKKYFQRIVETAELIYKENKLIKIFRIHLFNSNVKTFKLKNSNFFPNFRIKHLYVAIL